MVLLVTHPFLYFFMHFSMDMCLTVTSISLSGSFQEFSFKTPIPTTVSFCLPFGKLPLRLILIVVGLDAGFASFTIMKSWSMFAL